MSIGNNIYMLRTSKKLSQEDLAELLEVSRQSVSKWETDAAIPDLDKLIKLCDVFGVSLDEIAGRKINSEGLDHINAPEEKTFSTQRIIGFILFTFSLLLGIVALIFGHNAGDYLIMLPMTLALLVCGLLCLFAGRKAFYWCIWTLLAPLVVLTPHMIGLTFLRSLSVTMLIAFVIMFFVARAVYKDIIITKTPGKTLRLILAWLLPVAIYAGLICIHKVPIEMPMPTYVYSTSFTVLLNLICCSMVAILETYTVCYIKG